MQSPRTSPPRTRTTPQRICLGWEIARGWIISAGPRVPSLCVEPIVSGPWRPLDFPGDLTANGIRLFLQKLGDTSAAALLTGPEEIPSTQSKIHKVAVETWVRPGENPCGIQRGPSGVGVCCCSPRWRGAWPSARPVRAGEGTLRSTVSGGTQCYDET